MKRTSEWISSQEVSSDVTVHVGEASFSLHKFPLLSKCGLIKKLVSESKNDSDATVIKIPDIPGGSEAFELTTKFCYGINFDMSTENIAMLRCASEYLEMTEEHSVENLVSRSEAYLTEVALKSLSSAITVLHKSEDLLPVAERVKLVSRCIDAIAYMTCQESQFCSPTSNNSNNEVVSKQPVVDWWAEDLTVLRIDSFQRVLIAMMARGFKQYGLGPVLMLYAQKSLRGLEIFGKGTKKIEPKQEHEKRVILETIAHPNMSDVERKKVCSLMDCQKLSREACAHAAQNDRLPVQTIVQVLYYEQQRLRGEVTNDTDPPAAPPPQPATAVLPPPKLSSYNDELSKVKRENQDLKLELLKMKMKLKEFEKDNTEKRSSSTTTMSSNHSSPRSTASMDKPPLPRKSFMNSVSKKLGKLNPFGIPPRGRTKPPKDRRHSIS
ncbi:BTB/POZ domain-containing protein [Raphanus sativus]|nr:BTB/POZ domain-containing protein [Raphanus sativus]